MQAELSFFPQTHAHTQLQPHMHIPAHVTSHKHSVKYAESYT